MRIRYEKKNFADSTLRVIAQANAICAEYQEQGFDLTLRQLYYQFVSRDLIANKQTEYKRLGSIVNDARMAGLLDWDYIVDRTRGLESLGHFDDPGDVIAAAARSYHLDLWADQATRVEVWIEKDALTGVIEPTCRSLDVAYFSCRGYTSQSEMWGAAQRLGRFIEDGQRVVILHLGDHDPSGLDMTRDIEERLDWFTVNDYLRAHPDDFPGDKIGTSTIRRVMAEHCGLGLGDPDAFEVRRIALTRDQIDEYDPPPNPAKTTDARFRKYQQEHGNESWELDALDPTVLADLIRDEVESLMNEDTMQAMIARQSTERATVTAAARRWDEVVGFLGGES